eukprot:scaffold271337_cov37-Prasinocladus_malaysianus.AAC.1
MLLSGTPPTSPARADHIMDPGALGSALAALTHQASDYPEHTSSHHGGRSSMSWQRQHEEPPSAAETAAAVVAACRAASEAQATPSNPSSEPMQVSQPLTPISKRKREIDALFSENTRPSPTLPPLGQRRK